MSNQILAEHPSQLSMNATPIQKLMMDLSEAEEECLSGGEKLETLNKLQEEFQAELNRSSSSDLLFILIW